MMISLWGHHILMSASWCEFKGENRGLTTSKKTGTPNIIEINAFFLHKHSLKFHKLSKENMADLLTTLDCVIKDLKAENTAAANLAASAEAACLSSTNDIPEWFVIIFTPPSSYLVFKAEPRAAEDFASLAHFSSAPTTRQFDFGFFFSFGSFVHCPRLTTTTIRWWATSSCPSQNCWIWRISP